jgi:hypothetical protein
MANEFSVNFWGSKPGTNDDCITGVDFETAEEAMAAFHAEPADVLAWLDTRHVAWVEMSHPIVSAERKNAGFVATPDDDSADRAEHAMQAGMAFGCPGFNDARGCAVA